jgi:hypothetical protein
MTTKWRDLSNDALVTLLAERTGRPFDDSSLEALVERRMESADYIDWLINRRPVF